MHLPKFSHFALGAFSLALLLCATTATKLSDSLLDLASDLAASQAAVDISPVVDLVKANSATIDSNVTSPESTDIVKAYAACNIFKIVFPEKYIDISSPEYTAEVEEPVIISVWQNSTCFFKPTNTADVAFGLKIVTTIGSKFATRSGGHSQNPGWNAIAQGVLFDLTGLNTIAISADASYATIGSGQKWGQVYSTLGQHNKAVVGGRSFDVGVGGLILGVGIPYLSSTYGFACDNVKRFEIVLPNSTVVNATSDSHSDLWISQKGGGPNYGIVTNFDLFTIPSQIWYHVAVYNVSEWQTIIPAVVEVQQSMENDSNAGILFDASIDGTGAGQILYGMIYAYPTPRPAVFSPFDNITAIQVLANDTNGTIADLAQTVLPSSAAKQRYYSRAMSYQTDLQTYKEGFEAYLGMGNYNPGTNDTLAYGIQAITAAAVEAGIKRGGNLLGMKAESTNWWHAIATWNEPNGDVNGTATTVNMFNTMTDIAKKNGKYLDFVFANDAAGDQPSPLASYGAENLAKMKAVAGAYDPTGVMQTLQNAGFKLSVA